MHAKRKRIHKNDDSTWHANKKAAYRGKFLHEAIDYLESSGAKPENVVIMEI